MFAFEESKLNRKKPLSQGRFGPIYSYQDGQHEWGVEDISATHRQLPEIIEEIVIRFDSLQPGVLSFYMRPADMEIDEGTHWKIYIKQSLEIKGLKEHPLRKALFNFEEDKVKLSITLGKGGFGSIHPYQEDPEDDKWVVKMMSVTNNQLPKVIEEIMIGFSCQHPNVLPVEGFHIEPIGGFDADVSKWNIYIKLPRMKESLKAKLERHKAAGLTLTEQEAQNYFYQITAGLKYLHEKKIAHRDLKPGNILLDKQGNALIADMGQANLTAGVSEHIVKHGAGTIIYKAPELSKNELTNKDLFKADIWSLGLTLAEVCFIDIKVEGTGEEKEEILRGRIKKLYETHGERGFFDFKTDLLDIDCEKGVSVKEVEKTLNDSEAVNSLMQKAKELKRLDSFYKQLKQAKEEIIACNSSDLTTELRYELEDMFYCDPKNRPTIQDVVDSLNEYRARCLLIDQAKKSGHFEAFGKALELEAKESSAKIYQEIDKDSISFSSIRTMIKEALDAGIEVNVEELFNAAICTAYERIEEHDKRLQIESQSVKNIILRIRDELMKSHSYWFYFAADEVTQSLKIKNSGHCSDSSGHTNQINNQAVRNMLRTLHAQINEKNRQALKALTFNIESHDAKRTMHEDTFTDLVGTDIDPLSVTSLQKMSIDLSCCNTITAQGFEGLFKYIGTYHKKLSSLQLNFQFCHNLTDDAIKELALQIETNLQHLKRIDFCFRQCYNISEAAMIKLLEAIGMKQASLTNLTLDITHNPQFSGSVLIELGNQLQGLNHLFSLILYINPLGNEGCSHLFKKIGKLQKLSILKLDLLDYNLEDLAEKPLQFNNLSDKPENIEDDSKDLSDTSEDNKPQIMARLNELRLRDISVQELANSISQLSLLRILSLSFMRTTKITNDTARHLVARIGSNHDLLTNLTLRFSQCEEIKDGTVEELQNQLGNLSACLHLTLSFSKCFRISSKAVKALIRSINQDQDTFYQHLGLNFAGCSLLDESACEEIAALVSQKQIAERLVLNLSELVEDIKVQRQINRVITSSGIPGIEIKLGYE